MAEGLLRHSAGDRFQVESAGTRPAGLNPKAIEVMREIGIDISQQRSKNVSEISSRPFTYVITVCDSANQACPAFPGHAIRMHWSIEDPAAATGTDEQRAAVFREVRDQLSLRIREFLRHADGQ
jgi:arsenate reductase